MQEETVTRVFDSEELKQHNIRYVVEKVCSALKERGYNPITQLVGYLVTGDPAYISSYQNARSEIQSVERDDILKELIRYYLTEDKK